MASDPTQTISRRWPAALATAALAGVLGCGGGGMQPVSGTVRFEDGSAMESGFVLFKPEGGAPSRGVVIDGAFRLSTVGANDGAPVGVYRVGVVPDTPAGYDPDSGGGYLPKVPSQYFTPETSGLTFEVKPGKNQADFTLPAAKGWKPAE